MTIPSHFTENDCYAKIFAWHKSNGENKFDQVYKGKDELYRENYFKLINLLPSPGNETDSDRDFVFFHSLMNLMEWAYWEPDNDGIVMREYAEHAVNNKYSNGHHDNNLRSNAESSDLHTKIFNK